MVAHLLSKHESLIWTLTFLYLFSAAEFLQFAFKKNIIFQTLGPYMMEESNELLCCS